MYLQQLRAKKTSNEFLEENELGVMASVDQVQAFDLDDLQMVSKKGQTAQVNRAQMPS